MAIERQTEIAVEPIAPSIVSAQRVVDAMGKLFAIVSLDEGIVRTDHWDGYEVRVGLQIDGKSYEGYAVGTDAIEVQVQAFCDAASSRFPTLRGLNVSPLKESFQNGISLYELEFSKGEQRWASRQVAAENGKPNIGRLVAEGLMAGVHLL